MKNRKRNWQRDPFYWGSLTLVLLLMGLIFYFSSQTGVQSGGSSGRLDALFLRWLYPDFSAYSAQRQGDLYFLVDFIVRKTAHVLEFSALGFALRLHLQAVGRWITIRHPQFLAWGIGTLYAASDELHQFFSAGRAARLADVGIDSLGVILGLLFFLLCACFYRHNKCNRNM
ncbi:MAG: VanZ family protein [Oscillospiraceae bacterium]|nr:VanZ family protein [Oscillospiraceae bacterium]